MSFVAVEKDFLLNDPRHQERFYYMENMVASWWGISLSVGLLGILVHINLENLAGEVILIISILFGIVTLIGGMIWMFTYKQSQENFMKTRLYILYVKYALFTSLIGVMIYTLVQMFEKKRASLTPTILKMDQALRY